MELVPRFLSPPSQSFFLFGPRGTGKSLWTQQIFKNSVRLDLLAPDIFRLYSARPEYLQEMVAAHLHQKTIIIDEVQKVPELLAVVHQLIESNKNLQFVLTGSSARKLKRSGVDLLAGRAIIRTLHPFMAAELGGEFDFERALSYGLLPLVWNTQDPFSVLKAYHGLYLREEVQMEAMVRNIGSFSRFLEAISFSHASLLNLSTVARDCETERKTVEGYLQVLESLLLSFQLPVFTKRARRSVIKHRKFYLFDVGVFRTLRSRGPLDSLQEVSGLALEGLVAQHLVAWNAYRGENNTLYFWRTSSGVEVDFILYGEDGLWAIEVKNGTQLHPQDLRGLRAFKEDYPEASAILLYRGKMRLKKGDILCLPCEDFLRALHPARTLNEAV